jgi:enolase
VNNTKIAKLQGRQVFDSRGRPTVEVDVMLEGGYTGRAIVPSGASTGKHEALELRDGQKDKYSGKSVLKAVNHVNGILNEELKGMDAVDQRIIDLRMIDLDGTDNKKKLGANAILGVSIAVVKATAQAFNLPLYRYLGGVNAHLLPMPMVQMIGGGLHADGAIDIQDFLIIPTGAKSFQEAMEICFNVYHSVKDIYHKRGLLVAAADEGGLWPDIESNEQALEILTKGIEAAGYTPKKDVGIAIDIAASHFYENGVYKFQSEKRSMNMEEFVDVQEAWVKKYPIISIEDGCAEDDWDGWELLTERLGNKIQLIGDDLFVTNIRRMKQGFTKGICNSVLIKMNQIGTLTETLDAIELTKKAGYFPVVSARSGETEDTTIVDLSIALNAGQLKVGSITRSERLAKYNQLIRVEEELGDNAVFQTGEILNR